MTRRVFLILFLFLIIFCVQGQVLADLSYFEEVDAIWVKLYFLRSDEGCKRTELIPVECVIENNVVEKAVRTVLEKLLNGPTEQEKKRLDLWTSIPEGVKVNTVRVDKDSKTVFIDFSEEIQNYGGGSFAVICIRGQIEKTLKNFPEIDEVVITVEGRDEQDGVLQP
ncbi:GerMN domain-containing protein [Patescibacteria group bacterium]|nr:GerMN domain-containing protein [Patescibacteria group bacterium]